MRCSICYRDDRAAIDEAILKGEPNRRIAARCDASEAAVRRHGSHVSQKLARAAEIVEETEATTLLGKIRQIEADARRLLKKAEDEGDLRAAIAATKTALDVVGLFAKVASLDGSGAIDHVGMLRTAMRDLGERRAG